MKPKIVEAWLEAWSATYQDRSARDDPLGWSDEAWLSGCEDAGSHDFVTVRAITNVWQQERKEDECSRCGEQRVRKDDPNHLPDHEWLLSGREWIRPVWVCDGCAKILKVWFRPNLNEPCPRDVMPLVADE